MPPWVGSPCMVQPLPENKRYVCVACCFVDSSHLSDHQSVDSTEGGEPSVNRELQSRRPTKCTVVVIDSYTLTIVQTVFHGNLSVGPLKFMSVVMPTGDMEKQSVLMVDSFGKVQCVSILKDSEPNGENSDVLQKSSSYPETIDREHGSNEGKLVLAFATRGRVLALLYRSYCIFKLVDGGTTVGEISFVDDQLCPGGHFSQSHVIGGMFLEGNDTSSILYAEERDNIFVETFAVWNNNGYVIMYTVSYSGKNFKFVPLCEVPGASHLPSMELSISFNQLNSYLIRIESICVHVEEPMQWKPVISIWSLPANNGEFRRECKMFGQGNFFDDWSLESSALHKNGGIKHGVSLKSLREKNDLPGQQIYALQQDSADDIHSYGNEKGIYRKRSSVSSSMVISENQYTPYAVVYGFYSGEIEVLRFNICFDELDLHDGSPRHCADTCEYKQYLSGHTGAVLCLAAHQMVSTSKGWNCNHLLISGSMDCTIRVWDLDSGNLITVMHQHVLPVRQIILPPPQTDCPWSDCFLSVGEDSCVTLASLETLRVERMFPGHPYPPAKAVWDSRRGYIACLCLNHSGTSDVFDVLYIWDIKSGARERVLRGSAAHLMFDHFCACMNSNSFSLSSMDKNTSTSSLVLPITEDADISQSHIKTSGKGITSPNISHNTTNMAQPGTFLTNSSAAKLLPSTMTAFQSNTHPFKCSCPFPGIAVLNFDVYSLMSLCHKREFFESGSDAQGRTHVEEVGVQTPKSGNNRVNSLSKEQGIEMPSPNHLTTREGTSSDAREYTDWVLSLEGCLIRFSLSFLHLWNVDCELDKLLISEMKLKRPENFIVASGLLGDRGSLTLTFPGPSATLELWKSSSEFCAIRSLTMVSLAQHMISLSHSCSTASSALAAFYTRNFAEKIPDIKPPLLQLLVSFWQDESEHVRMAARSLFHCAASRAIPLPLCCEKSYDQVKVFGISKGNVESGDKSSSMEETSKDNNRSDRQPTQGVSLTEESEILAWLESFEVQDWISCVGGTSQDAMTSHIIVASALVVWYPSLVKPSLSMLTVHPLVKLVMAMNEKYSSTAAEILAEGMESTWRACINSEIPRLIGDIFFQIECVSGASAKSSSQNPATSLEIRETLVGILLPSLAMTDIPGFLHVIESQIWSTASDSPVHVVSLMTLIRVLRGSPRNLAQYLDKVVNFILQTMDPGNSVMRRICLQSSMATLKEVVRVFPMVALNDSSSRLAVGDAIGDINVARIRIYDMQSMTKIKVLDASGPPGLPTLLGGASEMAVNTAISALSFAPDGEGLVAFSEHGLMIRWWSLGSVWWERLSRNLVPVQCTKLIFVPPWEGFSANSTRSSIMGSVMGCESQANSQENKRDLSEMDRLKLLLHNLDLSYRLEWAGDRKVRLTRHGHELGTFQL